MTLDWKAIDKARILLIGHDPRLQKSETIAEFAFFADYYFRPVPNSGKEKSKYGLAKTTFDQIMFLTNNKYKPEQVYITNLCNSQLEHAPKNKIVLIPEYEAIKGLNNITKILEDNTSISYIFPMSVQVNYWLLKLEFYRTDTEFLALSRPFDKGINNIPPYYEPFTKGTFKLICGKIYNCNHGKQLIVPILHSKNYPLEKSFLSTYGSSYLNVREYFKNQSYIIFK